MCKPYDIMVRFFPKTNRNKRVCACMLIPNAQKCILKPVLVDWNTDIYCATTLGLLKISGTGLAEEVESSRENEKNATNSDQNASENVHQDERCHLDSDYGFNVC